MAVVLVHARGEVWETYGLLEDNSKNIFTFILYSIFSLGFAGVIVFFVLSGFLVGGRTSERILYKTADIKQYVIDRGVRIGLPLIGSLALIVIVDVWLDKQVDWGMLTGNLFALQGIFVGDAGGVFWTLSYEMWFYILFAGLILLLVNHKYIGVMVLAVALSAFTALNTYLLLVLLMGIMSYYLARTTLYSSNIILYISSLLFVLSVCGVMLASDSKAFDMSIFKFLNKDVLTIMTGFSAALFIADVVKRIPASEAQKAMDKVGSKLAVFSYSLYLTHWQVLRVINYYWGRSTSIDGMAMIKMVCTIIICIVFAYVFYVLTERNTAVVKGWFKKK